MMSPVGFELASRLLRIAAATALRAGPDPGDLCGPWGRKRGQAQACPTQRAALRQVSKPSAGGRSLSARGTQAGPRSAQSECPRFQGNPGAHRGRPRRLPHPMDRWNGTACQRPRYTRCPRCRRLPAPEGLPPPTTDSL
jgi:hypothetical protein